MNLKRLVHGKVFGGLFWLLVNVGVLWLILLNIGKVGEPGAPRSLVEIGVIMALAICFMLGVYLRCCRGYWPFEMSWKDLKIRPMKQK